MINVRRSGDHALGSFGRCGYGGLPTGVKLSPAYCGHQLRTSDIRSGVRGPQQVHEVQPSGRLLRGWGVLPVVFGQYDSPVTPNAPPNTPSTWTDGLP
ncbi:hypothetical protein, partial [Kribbella albertanoniae]|uniref:hypothetical protein n=1 Tax=Kribbella albertanoniae TaxID=1266829 RepID=UPI001EDF29EA